MVMYKIICICGTKGGGGIIANSCVSNYFGLNNFSDSPPISQEEAEVGHLSFNDLKIDF